MKEWILPKALQAEIASRFKAYGFDPLDFDLKTVASSIVKETLISSFVHRKTRYYIDIDTTERGGYFLRYSPGDSEPTSEIFAGGWSYAPNYIDKWINALKKELEAESPWRPFSEAQAFARFAASSENPSFTAQEQVLVHQTLDEVLQLIAGKVSLTDERLRLMEDDIRYLKESSQRIGKKDFVLLFLGWGINIALSNALPPEVISQVFQLVSEKLHHVFATLITLLQYFSQLPPSQSV